MDSGQGASLRPESANRSTGEAAPQASSSRQNLAVPQRKPLPSSNSSIRIRRLASSSSKPPDSSAASDAGSIGGLSSTDEPVVAGRRRSSSAPQTMSQLSTPDNELGRQTTNEHYQPVMPSIQERTTSGVRPLAASGDPSLVLPMPATAGGRPRGLTELRAAGSGIQAALGAANVARANRGLTRMRSNTVRSRPPTAAKDEYGDDVLGLLDLVDPEVQTLGTLTNVQNSLFVPDLGRWVNRRPTYDLTLRPGTAKTTGTADSIARSRAGTVRHRTGTVGTADKPPTIQEPSPEPPELGRRASISSELTERHYAVLPHGEKLEGWSDEDIEELNDHVRHLLHSRQEGFKRKWRGFKKYVSKPLGLFVFVYAVLVTLFGATWVIFLIGWIHVGDRQSYAVNVIDNVLVALFALMGDGLAPFRAVDTYHMCFIAHFHHLTWRLRDERAMPKLPDENDLPGQHLSTLYDDVEAGRNVDDVVDKAEFSVLSPIQQRRLQYHQAKFSKSHTFYRPHETSTHHAFPLRLLVAVVVLLDCHSLFQVALGTCTWSIDYKVRPEALTATILACSITCNIAAGVLVSVGDKRTRKKDVLEKLFRQRITREAIETLQRRHTDHNKHNYDELETGESPISPDHGKSKSSKDTPRFSLDLYRNEGHRPPKNTSKISSKEETARPSRDLGRRSMDISGAVASTESPASPAVPAVSKAAPKAA